MPTSSRKALSCNYSRHAKRFIRMLMCWYSRHIFSERLPVRSCCGGGATRLIFDFVAYRSHAYGSHFTSIHYKRNDLTQTRHTISKSRISQTKISMDCPYTIVVVVTGRMDLRPDHVFTKRLGRNRHYHGSRVADSASCLVCCFVHDGGVRYAQHWRLDLNIAD